LAEQSVTRTDGITRKGETIIANGQRVTEDAMKKLRSYERSKLIRSESIYSFRYFLGSIFHVAIIYAIMLLYLFILRKRIFTDNFQLGIISSILVFVAFLSWLSITITTWVPLEFFILIPSLTMLVAIVFDSRTAFYTTVTQTLIMLGIRGNDYDTGLAMLFAGILAAYTVRDIQSRTQMFKSIFYIFIGFVLPISAIGIERLSDLMPIVNKLVVATLNAAIAPLFTFGLLFFLERISNLTTDLRLQEYNNLDHPLLVKLNEYAPGTYQHTLSVAMLAERCARAIDANPLLAKVGTYFHDIGKVAIPEYFIENQIDKKNLHEGMTPKKSADAIKFHVLEGIRLAQEYKIPQRVIDFIPMHHGTSLILHFYALALEEAKSEPVNKDDFRYPGPKPDTKETALVMICDSSEAISRVVGTEKDELEKAINRSIQDKLLDGQFDDCDLTFTELKIIKETILKNLVGVSHPRVKYKEIPNEEK
jgi:hypothetical protein